MCEDGGGESPSKLRLARADWARSFSAEQLQHLPADLLQGGCSEAALPIIGMRVLDADGPLPLASANGALDAFLKLSYPTPAPAQLRMEGAAALATLAHALRAPAMLARVQLFVDANLDLSAGAATEDGGPHNALAWLAICHRVGRVRFFTS